MATCLESIRHWMQTTKVDSMLQLKIQQELMDIDAGRLEELHLIEQFKRNESIYLWRENALLK